MLQNLTKIRLWTAARAVLAAMALTADLGEKGIREILGMDGLTGLLVAAGLYAIIRYAEGERRGRAHGAGVLTAALFAGMVLIGKSFSVDNFYTGELGAQLRQVIYGYLTDIQPFSGASSFAPMLGSPSRILSALVIFAGCFFLFLPLIELAYARLAARAPAPATRGRGMAKTMGILILLWLPYMIANYPGALTGDLPDQIGQFFGHETYTSNLTAPIRADVTLNQMNPVLHTALVGGLIALFRTGENISGGIFAHCLIQTLAVSYVLARSLRAMERMGLPRGFLRFALAFYALNPLIPLYAFSTGKDVPFAMLLVFITTLLMEGYLAPEEKLSSPAYHAQLAVATVLLILFRSNAAYLAMVGVPAAYFAVGKGQRARLRAGLVVSLGLPILLCYVITGAIYPALGIRANIPRENRSLMYQQTARYALTYPDEVTDAERDAIAAVLPFDEFSYRYFPGQADPVKLLYNMQATRAQDDAYARVWRAQLIKHPVSYLEAAINMGYAYYYPEMQLSDYWMRIFTGASERYEYGGEVFEVVQPRLAAQLTALVRKAVLSIAVVPGIGAIFTIAMYTWALIAAGMLCVRARARAGLLLLPYAALMLGLGLTAINGSVRYALGLIFALPLILAICVFGISDARARLTET
ncbi:MAG: DUF6020 family protein [Christensenellales bacterium]